MKAAKGSILLLGLCLALGAQAQSVYKWVDKDGRVHFSDRPPPPDARKVEEKKPGRVGYAEAGTPYALQKAQKDFPVTLYRNAECDALCEEARALLANRGIPYADLPLQSDEDMASFRSRFGTAKVQVPSLLVGAQKQVGFEPGLWNRLLDDAGYPQRTAPGARPR